MTVIVLCQCDLLKLNYKHRRIQNKLTQLVLKSLQLPTPHEFGQQICDLPMKATRRQLDAGMVTNGL